MKNNEFPFRCDEILIPKTIFSHSPYYQYINDTSITIPHFGVVHGPLIIEKNIHERLYKLIVTAKHIFCTRQHVDIKITLLESSSLEILIHEINQYYNTENLILKYQDRAIICPLCNHSNIFPLTDLEDGGAEFQCNECNHIFIDLID